MRESIDELSSLLFLFFRIFEKTKDPDGKLSGNETDIEKSRKRNKEIIFRLILYAAHRFTYFFHRNQRFLSVLFSSRKIIILLKKEESYIIF